MSNGEYKSHLDSSCGSIHDHDDSEQKCWDCGGMFLASDLVNGKKFFPEAKRDFVPLCVPCYEEFERLENEEETLNVKQIGEAIHADVMGSMMNDLKNIHK